MIKERVASNVLVTGSHGFVGKYLVADLHGKTEDLCILDRNKVDEYGYLKWLLDDIDTVVHLAAKIRGDNDEEVFAGNVELTQKLLEAVGKIEGKKPLLIFSSTFACYGVQQGLLTEESETAPRNVYGMAKLATEKLIQEYAQRFEIPVLILRLSNVYGPGMPPYLHSVVSTFIAQAIDNKPFTLNGDGSQKRDFIYVGDVSRAIQCGLGWTGEIDVMNICSGIGTSMKQLIEKIIELTRSESTIYFPHPYLIEEGCWVGDSSKAEQILGWKSEVPLEEGLELTYKSLGEE